MTTQTETSNARNNLFRRAADRGQRVRGVGHDARTQPLNTIAWLSPILYPLAFALGMALAALVGQ